MRQHKFIYILSIIVLISTSCNKYKNQEILGEWEIESYYVNDHDSSTFFKQFNFPRITIINTEGDRVSLGVQEKHSSNVLGLRGNWELKDRNRVFTTHFVQMSNQGIDYWFESGPFLENVKSDWNIISLSERTLIIESELSQNYYRVNLRR